MKNIPFCRSRHGGQNEKKVFWKIFFPRGFMPEIQKSAIFFYLAEKYFFRPHPVAHGQKQIAHFVARATSYKKVYLGWVKFQVYEVDNCILRKNMENLHIWHYDCWVKICEFRATRGAKNSIKIFLVIKNGRPQIFVSIRFSSAEL